MNLNRHHIVSVPTGSIYYIDADEATLAIIGFIAPSYQTLNLIPLSLCTVSPNVK